MPGARWHVLHMQFRRRTPLARGDQFIPCRVSFLVPSLYSGLRLTHHALAPHSGFPGEQRVRVLDLRAVECDSVAMAILCDPLAFPIPGSYD